MTASEILQKHEDANEMHFHEVDRRWIIEAMEEYAAMRQPPVSGELAVDECKCIRFTGGGKWYPNGCKIHPNG